MIFLTRPQRKALYALYSRRPMQCTYKEFRASIQLGWGCVMVQWCNMWIGIESDGYTHS